MISVWGLGLRAGFLADDGGGIIHLCILQRADRRSLAAPGWGGRLEEAGGVLMLESSRVVSNKWHKIDLCYTIYVERKTRSKSNAVVVALVEVTP